MYQYKIKQIVKVIDGDTVDVDIDLGFNLTIRQRVRLKGINAPESRTTNEKEKKLGLESKVVRVKSIRIQRLVYKNL